MKKKRIVALFLSLLLLAGALPVFAATAGSAGDPLISLSYITDTYIPSMLNKAGVAITSAFAPLVSALSGGGESGDESSTEGGGELTAYLFTSNGSISLRTGGSVVLLSGTASLSIAEGAVVDVTNGVEAAGGSLTQNVRLLGAEDCEAVIQAAGAVLAVSGNVTVTGGVAAGNPFSDVRYSDWFYTDVSSAYGRGLVAGMTSHSYEPNGPLTLAQTVKLAACLRERYYTGGVTLENSTTGKWYQSYVDYARSNGILTGSYTEAEYDAAVSRALFVSIFYRALPAKEYSIINSVADGAVPDVALADSYAAEIYAFYRAGILIGNNALGSFFPDSGIRRSEAAAILTRMYDAGARKSITLPSP